MSGSTRIMRDTVTIYADYQATTPVDSRVLAAMQPHWREAFGNPHSSDHVMGWHAEEAVSDAAASVAALLGANADEVVFTSGATEANNLALLGLARRGSRGHRILVSAIEHKSVLATVRALVEREGCTVGMIPVDREGFVRLDVLEDMLDETVLVVSVMAVNNEIGTIQDVPRIAELLRGRGVLFHCDAAQAPCAIEMGDLASHADLVSLSGHKMYGPKGIGALYVRRDLRDRLEPLIYGGDQQGGLRSGTVPVPLCVGMAMASDILRSEEGASERGRLARLRDSFIRTLQGGPVTVGVNGSVSAARHPGNANVRFKGLDAQDILGALQPGLAAATGAACASGVPEPSHVLRALGLSEAQVQSSIRFSFGRFTTEDDITNAVHVVDGALTRLA